MLNSVTISETDSTIPYLFQATVTHKQIHNETIKISLYSSDNIVVLLCLVNFSDVGILL